MNKTICSGRKVASYAWVDNITCIGCNVIVCFPRAWQPDGTVLLRVPDNETSVWASYEEHHGTPGEWVCVPLTRFATIFIFYSSSMTRIHWISCKLRSVRYLFTFCRLQWLPAALSFWTFSYAPMRRRRSTSSTSTSTKKPSGGYWHLPLFCFLLLLLFFFYSFCVCLIVAQCISSLDSFESRFLNYELQHLPNPVLSSSLSDPF